MTAQAARRRADLLNDPHANMIDMYNVQCLKCGVNIKLSLKGFYDLHHWEKHRKRCNKWSEAYAARKRAENCIVRVPPDRCGVCCMLTKDMQESSRLSTPPPTPPGLMEDFGTDFTETSARSTSLATPNARSPTPEVAAKAEKLEEDVTPTRAAATRETLSPAPPPPTAAVECNGIEERSTEWPSQPRFPLSSHTQSAAAMALLHPDLEVLDLNKPLLEVPAWSWADVKPGTTVYRCTEWGRGSVLLSAAEWDDWEEQSSAAGEAGEE